MVVRDSPRLANPEPIVRVPIWRLDPDGAGRLVGPRRKDDGAPVALRVSIDNDTEVVVARKPWKAPRLRLLARKDGANHRRAEDDAARLHRGNSTRYCPMARARSPSSSRWLLASSTWACRLSSSARRNAAP